MILINLYKYSRGKYPKAGELWRFPVDAKPGSDSWGDMRWVQVVIPHGQKQYLFAARPELRIPGVAPMTYVDDPTPATGLCWYDANEHGGGHSSEEYSPPKLVLGAWVRTPAQAATAESQAKLASGDWHIASLEKQRIAAERKQGSGYAA